PGEHPIAVLCEVKRRRVSDARAGSGDDRDLHGDTPGSSYLRLEKMRSPFSSARASASPVHSVNVSPEQMTSALSPEARGVVDEEAALLARVRRARERGREREARKTGRGAARAEDALRELQEHAARASEVDLPSLLHDMAVSHRLARRPPQRLPDPSAPY